MKQPSYIPSLPAAPTPLQVKHILHIAFKYEDVCSCNCIGYSRDTSVC
jgi:hypothetical protein